MRAEGDSVGGLIECRVRNLPVGLGVPVFDRLEADLAKAMLSLPATKGFEIGSGFEGTLLRGSEHNDVFVNKDGKVGTATNRSGGVQGGISNGEELVFRVAFKPTATIIQNSRPSIKMALELSSWAVAGMILVWSPVQCPLSNRWLPSFSSTITCVTRRSANLSTLNSTSIDRPSDDTKNDSIFDVSSSSKSKNV